MRSLGRPTPTAPAQGAPKQGIAADMGSRQPPGSKYKGRKVYCEPPQSPLAERCIGCVRRGKIAAVARFAQRDFIMRSLGRPTPTAPAQGAPKQGIAADMGSRQPPGSKYKGRKVYCEPRKAPLPNAVSVAFGEGNRRSKPAIPPPTAGNRPARRLVILPSVCPQAPRGSPRDFFSAASGCRARRDSGSCTRRSLRTARSFPSRPASAH